MNKELNFNEKESDERFDEIYNAFKKLVVELNITGKECMSFSLTMGGQLMVQSSHPEKLLEMFVDSVIQRIKEKRTKEKEKDG